MVLQKEKEPIWGLNWREKVGVGLVLVGEKEKWAEIVSGELMGEP